MATTDVHRLQIVGVVGNQYVENIQDWQEPTSSSTDPLGNSEDLITAWQTAVQAAFLACLPSDYVLTGYKARRINNSGGPTAIVTAAAGSVGTRPTASVTSQLGPQLGFPIYVGAGGRPWRTNKMFLPGVAAGDLVENIFVAALITACNTLANLLVGSIMGTAVWQQVNYQKSTDTAQDLVEGSVRLAPGSQRRRNRPIL